MKEKETKTFYQRLQKARIDLQNKKLKKDAKNKYAGFDYYSLDILAPNVNEICYDNDLMTRFYIRNNEICYDVIDALTGEREIFYLPPDFEGIELKMGTDKQSTGMQPVQRLGSVTTYARRYLMLIAFEITEGEVIDALDNTQKEVTKTEKIVVDKPKKVEKTPEQIERENITNSIKKIVIDKKIPTNKVLEINKGKMLSTMTNTELLDTLMTFESLEV